MSKENSNRFPDYNNPPVSEVVCGLSFAKIEKFKSHHIGLFWQKVKDEFPLVEHAIRLGYNPLETDLKDYVPRVWFVRDEQNRLIQLQDDKFYFNWRRMQEGEPYPRYETIIEDFKKYLSVFEKFLEAANLGSVNPEQCELTYINHIPKGEGWETVSDVIKIFRDFCWNTEDRFLPPPINVEGRVVFQLPNNKGRLELILQQAIRKTDKHPMFVLNNKATGLGEDKNLGAVWEWFSVAHEWIVKGFTDLTTESAQKDVWQRTDTSV
jgi:uncharacterized protein (TIGR04255 family)